MRIDHAVDRIIKNALLEDSYNGDVTSERIFEMSDCCTGQLIAKEAGIIAGTEVFKRVFDMLDSSIRVEFHVLEGQRLTNKTLIATVSGPIIPILKGERIALNILQKMSGIATLTDQYVKAISGLMCRVVDTRKTSPGLRVLEKYAVTVGGGYNHRFNLSEAIMIKDNHIAGAGGIVEAVSKVKQTVPHTMKVEVEIERLSDLEIAIASGADIVMLDNMSVEDMQRAVHINNNRVILEASGNVRLETVRQIAETGVDVISSGQLTHSVSALDISLKFL